LWFALRFRRYFLSIEEIRKPGSTFLEVSVRVPEEQSPRSQMLPASKLGAIDLISDELTRGGKHNVYLKVVNFLSPVLHLGKA